MDRDIFTIKARRCQVCGRILVSAESVERGYGCKCAERVKKKAQPQEEQTFTGQMDLLDMMNTESEGKKCSRRELSGATALGTL